MSDRPIGLAPGASLDAAGQDAKKYATSNPVVRRLIARWLGRIDSLLGRGTGIIVDVGIGEGLALSRLPSASKRPVLGIEYRFDKLLGAVRRLPTVMGVRADAGMLPVRSHGAELVTCIEVLEHLVAPEAAVAELARITADRCVVSVPWEPWFRLGNLGRGKNVSRLGNDPEHVQQFTPATLKALLGLHFDEVELHKCFPWLVAVASAPSS